MNKYAAMIGSAMGLMALSVATHAAEPVDAAGVPLSGMAAAEAHVARMDPDHDGRISAAENAADAKRMFAKLDADGNGAVTAAEMNADRIRSMDTDKDGSVSGAEYLASAQGNFAKMDLDHDGFLVAQEILAAHNAGVAARAQKKP